jgi:hypothetical protein
MNQVSENPQGHYTEDEPNTKAWCWLFSDWIKTFGTK